MICQVFLFPAKLCIGRLRLIVVSLVIYIAKTYDLNAKLALWHLYTFIYFTEDPPDNERSRHLSNKFFRSNKDYNCAG